MKYTIYSKMYGTYIAGLNPEQAWTTKINYKCHLRDIRKLKKYSIHVWKIREWNNIEQFSIINI